MDRRGTDDPTGLGYFHNWAWSWPANRRVLYNRASADADGEPWDPTRPGISWNGTAWVGDVPDFPPTRRPSEGKGAFIMTGEGVARLFAPGSAVHRRAVPGALRADRVAGQQRSCRHPARPGGVPLRGGRGQLRRGRLRVPLRGHHLPGDRARALRHPARAVPGRGDARLLRRAARRAGRGERDQQRRPGEGPVQAGRGRRRAMVTKRMRPLQVARARSCTRWESRCTGTTPAARAGKEAQMANMLSPYIGDGNGRRPSSRASSSTSPKPRGRMASELGLAVRRQSATPSSNRISGATASRSPSWSTSTSASGARRARLRARSGTTCRPRRRHNFGSYQSHEDLTAAHLGPHAIQRGRA